MLSGTNMCGWVRVRSGVCVCVGVGGEDAGCEADEEGREGEAEAGWATRARRVGMSVLRVGESASQLVFQRSRGARALVVVIMLESTRA